MKVRSWSETVDLSPGVIESAILTAGVMTSLMIFASGFFSGPALSISNDPGPGFRAAAIARLREIASGKALEPVTPALGSGPAAGAAGAAVEPGRERQAFQRVGLAHCVAKAISRSAEVEGISTRLEAARLRARTLRVRRFPRPGAAASTRMGSGTSLDTVTVSVDFDLDHDGMAGDEARAAELDAANLGHADLIARNRVADMVTGLYLDALTARATARVARGSMESAESFLDRMQKSFDLKVVTPLDLLQAKSYHATELYRRDLATAGVIRASGALNIVLGLPYGETVELLEIEDPVTLPSIDNRQTLISMARQNRADVLQSRKVLAINRLRLSAAVKAGRTRVSLFGASGWNGSEGDLDRGPWNVGLRGTNDTFNGSFSFEAARSGSPGGLPFPGPGGEETGLTLRYVHNTGFEREIAISSARSEVRRQELSLRDLSDSIVEGINAIILDIGVERARERSLVTGLEAKVEEKRKKSKEFDLGLETAEQLLDVSSELVAAETDLTLARYRILRRLYQLVRELYAFDRSWLHPELHEGTTH